MNWQNVNLVEGMTSESVSVWYGGLHEGSFDFWPSMSAAEASETYGVATEELGAFTQDVVKAHAGGRCGIATCESGDIVLKGYVGFSFEVRIAILPKKQWGPWEIGDSKTGWSRRDRRVYAKLEESLIRLDLASKTSNGS